MRLGKTLGLMALCGATIVSLGCNELKYDLPNGEQIKVYQFNKDPGNPGAETVVVSSDGKRTCDTLADLSRVDLQVTQAVYLNDENGADSPETVVLNQVSAVRGGFIGGASAINEGPGPHVTGRAGLFLEGQGVQGRTHKVFVQESAAMPIRYALDEITEGMTVSIPTIRITKPHGHSGCFFETLNDLDVYFPQEIRVP